MKGFFSALELPQVKKAVPQAGNCSACGLYKNCETPKMEFAGEGKMKILLVGSYPSDVEDRKGTYGGTEAWQYLVHQLDKIGIDWKNDCWWTNAVKCHPKNASPKKLAASVDHCRPFLLQLIKELKPAIIIPFGSEAVESLIAHVWKADGESYHISRWKGYRIPCQELNAWINPVEHPSHILDQRDRAVADLLFAEDLRAALSKSGPPFAVVPDYASEVEIMQEPRKAAGAIAAMAERGGLIAFDYETNCRKPDSDKAAIYSCSLCWRGKKTIAFPWVKATAEAMSKLLLNPKCRMIVSNLQFELRWTMAVLGHGVATWDWDTMLSAHADDNRPDTKSVKFQSFVLLGQKDYDSHITPYLRSVGDDEGGNSLNRIHEIPLELLLLYNGLDSLLEYEVAVLQKREMARKFGKESIVL